MKTIAAITIGQSPRDDIFDDLIPVLSTNILINQIGMLDGINKNDIEIRFKPDSEEYCLVTRLNDGSQVKLAKNKILGLMQEKIDFLQNKCSTILILCTASFERQFNSKIPIIYPQEFLYTIIPIIVKSSKLLVVVPNIDQVRKSEEIWGSIIDNLEVIHGSPYLSSSELDDIIFKVNSIKPDFILLDCMGYTIKMKNEIRTRTGKSVILSKTLITRIISECI